MLILTRISRRGGAGSIGACLALALQLGMAGTPTHASESKKIPAGDQVGAMLLDAEIASRHRHLNDAELFAREEARVTVAIQLGLDPNAFRHPLVDLKNGGGGAAHSDPLSQAFLKFAADDFENAEKQASEFVESGAAGAQAERIRALELAACCALVRNAGGQAIQYLNRAVKIAGVSGEKKQWSNLKWQGADLIAAVVKAEAAADLFKALDSARNGGSREEELERLVLRFSLGQTLAARRRYVEARKVFEEVLQQRQKLLGPSHPDTLLVFRDLADLLVAQGEPDAALQRLREAVERGEKSLPNTSVTMLLLRGTYGHLLWSLGKFAEAEKQFRTLLPFECEVFGEESNPALMIRNNVILMLQEQAHFAEAEKEFRDLLRLESRVLGENHPDTLSTRNNLANTLQREGKAEEAEREFRATFQARAKVLGPEHPKTLASWQNLVLVLAAKGNFQEEEKQCRELLEVELRVVGREDPVTLATWHNLAVALGGQGKYEESDREALELLPIRERILGKNHPDVALSCNLLATNYRAEQKLAQALEYAGRAVAASVNGLGAEHPVTLAYRYSLAMTLSEIGKPFEAGKELKDLKAIYEAKLGPEHARTLGVAFSYAECLRRQGRRIEAEQENRRILAIRERVLGPLDIATLMTRGNLALSLSDQGKPAEAEQEFRRVLELYIKKTGPEDFAVLSIRNNLASSLMDQGKLAEAEEQERMNLQVCERLPSSAELVVNQSRFESILSVILSKEQKWDEALLYAKRSEQGFRERLGPDNSSTRVAIQFRQSIENQMQKQRKPDSAPTKGSEGSERSDPWAPRRDS